MAERCPIHIDTHALSHNDPWPTKATLKEAEVHLEQRSQVDPTGNEFLAQLHCLVLSAPYTASKSFEYKIRAGAKKRFKRNQEWTCRTPSS